MLISRDIQEITGARESNAGIPAEWEVEPIAIKGRSPPLFTSHVLLIDVQPRPAPCQLLPDLQIERLESWKRPCGFLSAGLAFI